MFGLSALTQALSGPVAQEEPPAADPRLTLDPAVFPCLTASYASQPAAAEGRPESFPASMGATEAGDGPRVRCRHPHNPEPHPCISCVLGGRRREAVALPAGGRAVPAGRPGLRACPPAHPRYPLQTWEPHRNYLSEAVIGSLPAGLSVAERQSIAASTPLSSTLKVLGALPGQKVTSPTEEGQRLRRQALKGAVLVFITAGYPGGRRGGANEALLEAACGALRAWHAPPPPPSFDC